MPIPTIPKDLTPAAPTEATAYQDYSNFQEMTPATFQAQFASFEVRMEATKKELQAQIQEEQNKLAQTLKNLKSEVANLETRVSSLEATFHRHAERFEHRIFQLEVLGTKQHFEHAATKAIACTVANALDALHTGVPHVSVVQSLSHNGVNYTRDGEKFDS